MSPQAPTHVLVIPTGAYQSMDDFCDKASDEEISGFFRAVGNVARQVGAVENGYRIASNIGADANQEIQHLHVHILAGKPLGRLLSKQ